MRLRSSTAIVGIAFSALAISGCGGGGGGGNPPTSGSSTTPQPIVMDHSLPTGDTFNTVGTSWDITGVKTTLYGDLNQVNTNNYDSLRVDVTFAQNVSNALPAPGQSLTLGSQLGVQVGIDISPAASLSTAPFDCETQNTSVDFSSTSTLRLADGNFPITNGSVTINQSGNPTTEAQTIVSPNTISQTFRLGPLGIAESTVAPELGVLVIAGNGDASTSPTRSGSQISDCAPRNVQVYLTK